MLKCDISTWKIYNRRLSKTVTMSVHLDEHCAWTITEQSPCLKLIVMGRVWVEQTLANPILLLPIDPLETRGHCCACRTWNSLCYFQILHHYYATNCKYNMEYSKFWVHSFGWERGVRSYLSMHVYTNEYSHLNRITGALSVHQVAVNLLTRLDKMDFVEKIRWIHSCLFEWVWNYFFKSTIEKSWCYNISLLILSDRR